MNLFLWFIFRPEILSSISCTLLVMLTAVVPDVYSAFLFPASPQFVFPLLPLFWFSGLELFELFPSSVWWSYLGFLLGICWFIAFFWFVLSSISLRDFLISSLRASIIFMRLFWRSFFSVSSALECSGLAGVESLNSGGVVLVFLLLTVFLYCFLHIPSFSGSSWGLFLSWWVWV